MFKSIVAFGLAAMLGATGLSSAAQAQLPVIYTTYYFNGLCDDCAGTAQGELVLANYTRNMTITNSNFVSFHYDGTDLIPGGFTIINDADLNVGGSINDDLPSAQYLYVYGTMTNGNHQLFETFKGGYWCTGYDCFQGGLDEGPSHSWGLTADSSVPEPASWALMVGGFGMIGAALRGRAKDRRRAEKALR